MGFRCFLRAICLVLLIQFASVRSDITDGNAEHLKREHSLVKPYQGKYQLACQRTRQAYHC